MPLPAGFVIEDTAKSVSSPTVDPKLPQGFVVEGQDVPQINEAPPEGIFDRVSSFFRDENKYSARAMNIYALAEETGLPLNEVNKNYDLLRYSSDVTGIDGEPDPKKVMQTLMLPGVAAGVAVGLATAPVPTVAGLVAFGALEKVIPTQKLIDSMEERGISDEVVKTVEVADMIGKMFIAHRVAVKAKPVAEAFMKRTVTNYKLPETVSLTPEQVQDIYQTGSLTTAEQKSLWANLELNSYDRRAALEHGVNINIPSEKIVKITDNPLWAKVKNLFGKSETQPVTKVTRAGEPAKGPAGLIEGPDEISMALRQSRMKDLVSPEDLSSPAAEKDLSLIQEDLGAFDRAYLAKLKKEYKSENPDIISADVARTADIPSRGPLSPQAAADRHAGSSAYAKLKYEESLANTDKDVTLLAGASGAGKTGAIRKLASNSLDADIIYDTNVASFESGKKIIEKALESDPERMVDIFYVDRDPVVAFEQGVVPRFLDPNGDRRVVSVDTHMSNIKSKDAIQELFEHYKDNPRVNFTFVGNYGERGAYSHLTIDEIKSKVYTPDKIRKQLETGIQEKLKSGILTQEEADAFLKKNVGKTGLPGKSVGSPDGSKAQQVASQESPVQKLIAALKEADDVRAKQETLYEQERSKKFAKLQSARKGAVGEKGYFKELGALKGELPKVEFEAIRGKMGQADIDSLFDMIRRSPRIGEWEKINAQTGLAKMFGEEGGRVPTEGEIDLLGEVFGEELTKVLLEKRPMFKKMLELGLEIANIPRSLMASFDLSAPLRQGVFLVGRPKQFGPAFGKMFGAFVNDKAYTNIQDAIINHPDYQIARDSGLSLTDLDSRLGSREESFMSSMAEKIPGVGKLVKASGRAYVGFLNKLRYDVFVDLVNKAENLELNPRKDRDLTKSIADFVNNATGRGSLPNALSKSAVALNTIFFSPRLIFSRLNLLNPAFYLKQKPFVRKEALKSLFTFVGAGLTILSLAKISGAEVGDEPRSSDFGKVKIGNTRFDMWGGFQPLVRASAQIATGKYISSTTGKEMTLGEGYKPMTRADIVQRFVEGKLAPIPSFIVALMKQQEPGSGKPVSVQKEIGKRFVPMVLQDLYDLAQESPELLPAGLLSLFGVGVQTYEDRARKGF